MKTQLDSFYKHYCENASEGNAPPPIVAAPSAPAHDWGVDIDKLREEMMGQLGQLNDGYNDLTKRVSDLEENVNVVWEREKTHSKNPLSDALAPMSKDDEKSDL